jgi:hypothetical protein
MAIMTAQLSYSRKKTSLSSYGATKTQVITLLTYVFTQVRRWQEGIWLPAPEINGRTTASTQWTGNTWTSLSRTSLICMIWRSKQHSGFCGTGGTILGHERCPNCGRRETAAHLMLCPDDSRTKLLVENVDDLTTWMSRDNQTDPEILYWIPKYILMGVTGPSRRWVSCLLSSRRS